MCSTYVFGAIATAQAGLHLVGIAQETHRDTPAPHDPDLDARTRRAGTRLRLHQPGAETLNWWWRFSMAIGWNRMLKTLLPKVLGNVPAGFAK